jgi:hypothetical protein
MAHDFACNTRYVTGARLFGEGAYPAAFTLAESLVASNGVIFANYIRAGEVKTGTIGT